MKTDSTRKGLAAPSKALATIFATISASSIAAQTITATAADLAGNTVTRTATCRVPHDM